MVAQERIRAWFLIQAASGQEAYVRGELRDLDEEHGDSIVVVRVDEVSDGIYNLVAPIDVENEASFGEVINKLDELQGGKNKSVTSYHRLKVISHDPNYAFPHLAAGYIAENEIQSDSEHNPRGLKIFAVVVAVGRQMHSPGFTPWG